MDFVMAIQVTATVEVTVIHEPQLSSRGRGNDVYIKVYEVGIIRRIPLAATYSMRVMACITGCLPFTYMF